MRSGRRWAHSGPAASSAWPGAGTSSSPRRCAAREPRTSRRATRAARRAWPTAGRASPARSASAACTGARAALDALGERIGALLATSAVAHGLFAGLPYDIGIAGGFSSPLAAELLPQADLVLAFGATLNHWTTRHGALLGDRARIVQVD